MVFTIDGFRIFCLCYPEKHDNADGKTTMYLDLVDSEAINSYHDDMI